MHVVCADQQWLHVSKLHGKLTRHALAAISSRVLTATTLSQRAVAKEATRKSRSISRSQVLAIKANNIGKFARNGLLVVSCSSHVHAVVSIVVFLPYAPP